MNALQKFFGWLGFDPIALSGAPSDYELLYLVGLIAALALGVGILVATPILSANRYRFALVVAFVFLAWGLLMIRDYLTISFTEPAQGASLEGVAKRVETRVAIPMPWLRSEKFPYALGSQQLDGTTGATYLEESRKPENMLALRATVGLHWLTFIMFLASLIAANALVAKVVLGTCWRWLVPRLEQLRLKLKRPP